jgi:hypothetical protein
MPEAQISPTMAWESQIFRLSEYTFGARKPRQANSSKMFLINARTKPVNSAAAKFENIFPSNVSPPRDTPMSTTIVMSMGKISRLASHQKPLPLKFGRKPKSAQPSPPKARRSRVMLKGARIHKSCPSPDVPGADPGGTV